MQYKKLFLREARSKLKELEDEVLLLEKNAADTASRDRVLVILHGLKSDAATMNFLGLANAVHSVEDFFISIREGRRILVPTTLDNLFVAIDAFRKDLDEIEQTTTEVDLAPAVAFAVRSEKLQKPAPEVKAEKKQPVAGSQYEPLGSYVDVASEELDAALSLANDVISAGQQAQRQLQKGDTGGVRIGLYNLATKASSLRQAVVSMKMIPVKQYFVFLARLTRDIAREQRKFISFRFADRNLRFERHVLESIREICVQLIKNAVDHGFREGERGTVSLSFNFKAGKIYVQVADNGHGIDWKKLRAAAIQRKLVPAGTAVRLPQEQQYDILFKHGVSSRERATLVSGRGLGLTLASSAVKRLGGSISFESRGSGKRSGTVFEVAVPLSPTLFRALTWRWGPYRLALPLFAVENVIQLGHTGLQKQLKTVAYRGTNIPVLALETALAIPPQSLQGLLPETAVILKNDDRLRALLLPAGVAEEELIVQPLASLRRFAAVSGAAVSEESMPVIIINHRSIGL